MTEKASENSLKTEVQEALVKYKPERPYKERKYKPYKKGFPDLCGSCKCYYKELHGRGLVKTELPVTCKGHIADSYRDLEEEDFDSPEEFTEVLVMSDPVSWAYAKLNWQARFYQEEMMSCLAGDTP
jgi:hypothetical protein